MGRNSGDDLEKLGSKLDQVSSKRREADAPGQNKANGLALAMRMGMDLVAAVMVGGFVGYLIDQWLGIFPALSLVFFVLGCVAGMKNMLATAKRAQEPAKGQDRDPANGA